MENVRIEFSRHPSDRWARLRDIFAEDFSTEEDWQLAIEAGVKEYHAGGSDYITRAVIQDTLDVIHQRCAPRGAWLTNPENVDIPFTLPGGPARPASGEFRHMIKVGIDRVAGKLCLLVNAKEFHEQLDEIGCTYLNNRYNDRPASASTIATNTHLMSTEVLLLRDYKEVEIVKRKKAVVEGEKSEVTVVKMPVTACIDLSAVWSNPPSFEQLKKLCNSANDAARKILEHYQPIDICVEIHKKIVK